MYGNAVAGQKPAAERGFAGPEGHALEDGAAARGKPDPDVAGADDFGIGDLAARQHEHRLGMPRAERPGAFEEARKGRCPAPPRG